MGSSEAPPAHATRTLNILVAEDNTYDFLYLQRVLKKADVANLFHVVDGQQAIDFLAGEGAYQDRSLFPVPDVLLLDLNLPRVSGHEVLEWIRSRGGLPPLRTYVLSGSEEENDRNRAQEGGATDYFVKPLSLGHVALIFDSK